MVMKPIKPFEPIRVGEIPQGDQWIAQVKWDGVRILTYYDGEEIRLINRRGNDRTLQYPELLEIKTYCRAESVILDGEIIALDNGKPAFHQVMRRDSLRKSQEISFALGLVPVIYMIFDILYCNGEWVNELPLAERQRLLTDMIIPNELVQIVPNVSDASRLYTVMEQRGWEGIVCKRLDSTYPLGGKDSRWVKLKLAHDLYAVVGGVTFRDGLVNALLLGLFDDQGHLNYIGHAGPGKCSHQEIQQLSSHIAKLEVSNSVLTGISKVKAKGAVWIEPILTVKVQFMEWTPGGTMRHPVIQGLVSVSPEVCTISQNL